MQKVDLQPRLTRNQKEKTFVFFGGGTGGHLAPGLSVAEYLRDLFGKRTIAVFFSGKRKSERVFGDRYGFQFKRINISQPKKIPVVFCADLFYQFNSLKRFLLQQKVTACFGLGGYASFPGVLAAKFLGIPVFLLEQNAVAGRVNRFLISFADYMCTSFPKTLGCTRRGKIVYTGNPVRKEFLTARIDPELRSEKAFIKIAVLGGSQGARALNQSLIEALPGISEIRADLHFVHSAGPDHEQVAQAYRRWGIPAEVAPFFNDICFRIADADIAFSRAGGSMISELLVLGIPSVLIPYPYARDDHQAVNGDFVEKNCAGFVCRQEDFGSNKIVDTIKSLIFEKESWKVRAQNAFRLGRPDAAKQVVSIILKKTNTDFKVRRKEL